MDYDYDYDLLEEWQAYSFICNCVQYCDNRKGRHQRFRQVDDEKLADILAGHVDPGFFDSLTVENIVREAQLEMEQQKATGVHDAANKTKNKNKKKCWYSFQRRLRMQKTIQQPWPLGPIRSKVRTNPRTGKREVMLSFFISGGYEPRLFITRGYEPQLFKSDLDSFYKRSAWKCRRPLEVEQNRRTGLHERLQWNMILDMELFDSDYEMIMRNRQGWKECPDHSFAKIMTRFFPVISVALLQVHLHSNVEINKHYEDFAFYNKVHYELYGKCHVSKELRSISKAPSAISRQLLHHQGACVGSIALLSALYQAQSSSYSRSPENTRSTLSIEVLLLAKAGYLCRMDGCLRHVTFELDWQLEERKSCLGYL
jgi:hypothetical protein